MTCAWENTLEIHMTRTRTLNSTPGPLLGRLLTYHSFQLEEQRNAKNVLIFCFKLAPRSERFKKVPLTTDVKISLRARFCSPAIRIKKRDKSSHFVPRTESFALRNRCPSGADLIPPERIQNFNKRVTRSHVYRCITYSDLNQQQIDSR